MYSCIFKITRISRILASPILYRVISVKVETIIGVRTEKADFRADVRGRWRTFADGV
jgi:hypothetical protein